MPSFYASPHHFFQIKKRFYCGKIKTVHREWQIWCGDGIKGGGGNRAVRMKEVEGSTAERRGEGERWWWWSGGSSGGNEVRVGGGKREEEGGLSKEDTWIKRGLGWLRVFLLLLVAIFIVTIMIWHVLCHLLALILCTYSTMICCI